MKKLALIILVPFLILILDNCSSQKSSNPEKQYQKTNIEQTNKGPGTKGDGKRDQKGKNGTDADSMADLPDHIKKAIKDGKIPRERVQEMLQKRGSVNAPLVSAEPVTRRPINKFLVLNGVVEPEKKVDVYARLSTFIKEIVKEEGDLVQKNDVLALLDDSEINIAYQQARIQTQQAQITLADEEKKFNRYKELKDTDLVSEQDFQTTQLKFQKARLDYENKKQNQKNLELQFSYTRIKSPIDGYVTERLVEVGDKVNNNQQVFSIEDFTPLLIKVYIPTSDMVHLKKGMDATISTDVLKGFNFSGKVKLINPRIDVQTGTVKITIEVFDALQKLKPGMFVDVNIIVSNNPNALTIPKKGVIHKQNKTHVFLLQDSKVLKREVVIGITEDDYVEILEGLQEGDQIVSTGIETLEDQMKVRVVQ